MAVVFRGPLVRVAVVVSALGAAALVPAPALAATPKPKVTKLSVVSGPLAGHTRVTVRGKHFTHVRSVTFGSSTGTSVTVESATKLLVTAPAHKAGRVDVRVKTSAGRSPVVATDRFTYVAPPARITGASVTAATATSLTLHWTNPKGGGFAGVVIRRAAGTTAPASPTAGTFVTRTNRSTTTYQDHGLTVGKHYAYALFAFGTVGGYAKPVDVSGMTVPAPGWTPSQAPLPADASLVDTTVSSVACDAPGSCMAVGGYTDNAGGQGLIDSTSGGGWQAATAPLPVDADTNDAALLSVACGAPATCAAVGHYTPMSGSNGLIETGSGTAWTALQAVLPGDANAIPRDGLSAVACAGASCVALGTYQGTDDAFHPMFEMISGGAASGVPVPLPGNAAAVNPAPELDSVACGAAGVCVAVGDYRDTDLAKEGLIETLSGGTWTATEAPLPSNAVSFLDLESVSCGASGSCAAVGTYGDTSNQDGLLETLAAGTWTATEAPADSSDVILTSISCPAAGSCVAVGSDEDNAGQLAAVTETLSAGTWTGVDAPLPANAEPFSSGLQQAGLDSVACGSVSLCVARGAYVATSGATEAMIETRSAGTWSVTEAPLPANANTTEPRVGLTSTACGATAPCIVVGHYTDTDGAVPGLIETQK